MDVFKSVTGQELEKRIWLPEGKPRAVLQLVHGMAEHIGRYDRAAKDLAKAGFVVVGHTHLGHGEKAEIKGYFGEKNGWDNLIEDVHRLRLETQALYPELPYFLLGHSMGSFVARGYCLKYEKGLAGVILSGTGHYAPALVKLAHGIASVECGLGLSRKPSRLMAALVGAGSNKGYEDVRTPFDWLTRDRDIVAKYVADPLCGFPFAAAGYRDMFEGLSRLYPEKLGPMEKDIPVLLFSGEEDPVGAHGEGVRQVAQELRDAGVKDVALRLYPKGRHEMLNELNREEVIQNLVGDLMARLPENKEE